MSKARYSSKRHPKQKGAGGLLSNPLVWVLAGIVLLAGAFLVFRRTGQSESTQAPSVNVEVSGAPSLQVDKEKVDLGDVPVDQNVTVSFQLANVGDETLRFSKQPYIEVKEGC